VGHAALSAGEKPMSSFELVNGYVCHNCTDVAYAKRNIDPQHPKDGPFGADKAQSADKAQGAGHGPAVTFGGSLAKPDHTALPDGVNGVAVVNASNPSAGPPPLDNHLGGRIDLSV
jgi:hypothetical protein